MCGHHDADGNPVGHSHGPVFRPQLGLRSRRAFLGELGKGTLAMAVMTPAVLAACSADDGGTAGTTSSSSAPSTTQGTTTSAAESTTTSEAADSTTTEAADAENTDDTSLRWARANLGFVSAYVLARGNRAAIVDTGVAGSAGAIGVTLAELGLNFDDVDHVVLTHHHGDHAGSIAEVLAMAPNATTYVGEADAGEVDADSVAVVGGADVFGFELLATPGHTAGHMAVIDHETGLLVAGDAIWTADGGVAEGPERFFSDVQQSRDTIQRLASLSFNTLLVGHGDPLEGGADSAMAALAASF